MASPERLDLRSPCLVVPGQAVDEDERESVALFHVVDAVLADRGERHDLKYSLPMDSDQQSGEVWVKVDQSPGPSVVQHLGEELPRAVRPRLGEELRRGGFLHD